MSVIHWQFCPPVQSPAHMFSARESQRGQKQWLVWHEAFLWCETGPPHRLACRVWWQRHHSMVQVSIPAPLRHTAGTYSWGQWKHRSQGRVSVPVSLRNVPPRGWLPPAQHMGALGEGCLPSSWIISEINRGSGKTGCNWNLGMVFRPHHLSAAWT